MEDFEEEMSWIYDDLKKYFFNMITLTMISEEIMLRSSVGASLKEQKWKKNFQAVFLIKTLLFCLLRLHVKTTPVH